MSAEKKKPVYPTFMVFREAFKLPDGRDPFTILNDPNAPIEEKEAIRRTFNADQEVAESTAERDRQTGRQKKNHERRDKVMADLRLGANGRPRRGEPKRLAREHKIPLATVQGWIEQWDKERSRVKPKPYPDDWRTVYHGQALRAWYRHPKKRR